MRLAKVKEEFGDALNIQWKSFLLRPYAEPKSMERFREYTESWMRPAGQPDSGEFRVWSTDAPPPSHSVPPNLAVKAAAQQGHFEDYHIAVMRAYFYENRNVTNPKTLLEVAGECRLDLAAFLSALKDEGVGKEVARDHNEAVSRGVTGVPCVVLDDGMLLPGAQDLAFYRHVINKRLSMQASKGGN